MPASFSLRCLDCGGQAAASLEVFCPSCGGLFEVAYEEAPLVAVPRLPLADPAARLTLGEGDTPVIELRRTADRLGLARLWAKLEFVAPTGSFKDRGSAVLVSAAREHGATEFVEDSSGNAGASLAAYAAAAGMRAHIIAPASASGPKLSQIRAYGAELHLAGGGRQAAADAALAFATERGLPYLSHSHSPYFMEGMKSFAHETARSEAETAEHAVFPVGNGSLLIGSHKGWDELRSAGRIAGSPRLHCVQANAVRPIVAAQRGEAWNPADASPTIAGGIAVPDPPRLRQALAAVSSSGGSAIAVAEDAILTWQRRLARQEGVFCEATAAAAFAGLEALVREGVIARGATALVPVTGPGLKENAAG